MSFMLPFRMIVATHSRRSLRSENVQTNFTPNSFPLNPFADPHPLTPVASIFYKNIGGGGTVSPFQLLTSKSLTSLFATLPRNPPVSVIIATLPETTSRKSFVCHTCETTPGGFLPFTTHYALPPWPNSLPRVPRDALRSLGRG